MGINGVLHSGLLGRKRLSAALQAIFVPQSAFRVLSTDIRATGKKPVFLDMVNYTVEQEES
jgi:hypothetical protein